MMGSTAPLITIRLLGPPLVECAGVPWSVPHLKAQALLYYLAASRQPYTRDHLSALLWGDAELSNARHSLRSTLYRLRQALAALGASNVLLVEDDRLTLNWRLIECDLVRFQELITACDETTLRAAVNLIRGSFLQGFSLPDAVLFDEFVQQQESWVTRQQQRALEQLSHLAERREDWDQAISDLQALIRLDPLDEEAHQRLMALYVRSGSPGLARRHYQFVERTLQHELGVAPAEETRTIVHNTLSRQRTLKRANAARSPVIRARPHLLSFTGRDAPLARLQQMTDLVMAGNGYTVLIEGEAGIGKSRLIDEFARQLQSDSSGTPAWQVLKGRCSPFDTILAYGAFREAFNRVLPDDLDEPDAPEQAAGTISERFARLILNTLTTLSQITPVVLVIDDLHLADQLSMSLFGYLAFRIQHMPVLLIGTVQRLDETAALQELTALGRRRGELEHIRLAPLTSDDVQQMLIDSGISKPASMWLAPWLTTRSGGNPFVIEALIDQLRSERLLVAYHNGWQFDIARWIAWRSTTPLPESTHDLVKLRLDGLSRLARLAIDLLAIASERLPLPVLINAMEADTPAVHTALEELFQRRLAVEQGDAVLLAHGLVHEVVVRQLSRLARRSIHSRLASAWEQHGASIPGAAEQIARHAVACGNLERARRFGLALLSDLPHLYTGAETIAFLQQLDDLVRPVASPDEKCLLAHVLGQAYRSLGQVDQARNWHLRQLTLAQQANLVEAEAIAFFELAEMSFIRNDYSEAINAAHDGLKAAERASTTRQPSLLSRGHRLLGGALAMEGSDLQAAEQHLRAAIPVHRAMNDGINLSAALFELGNVVAQQGAIRQAIALYHEADAALPSDQAPFLHALAANNLSYHSLLLGRLDDARTELERGRTIAEQHDLSAVLLHLLSTESEIYLYTGNWEAAEVTIQHGQALAESLGNLERQAGYRAALGLVAAGRGRYSEAREQLEAALTMIANHTFWHMRTRLLLWLAELSLTYEPHAANPYLDTALTLARTQRRRLLQIQAERLQAIYLAHRDLAAAQARLLELLDQAAALDLPLDVARTRATLARITLQHAPRSAAGLTLYETALRDLSSCGAQAEIAILRAFTAR